MAKVNGVPGYTQFDKVNILGNFLIRGVPISAEDSFSMINNQFLTGEDGNDDPHNLIGVSLLNEILIGDIADSTDITLGTGSALNLISVNDDVEITAGGNVNFIVSGGGEVQENGNKIYAGKWENVVHINQGSTAATQEPTALDTPLRIEFGVAVGTGADPIMMDATGLITVNVTDTYIFDVILDFGRLGSAQISELLATLAIDGAIPPTARPIYASIDNANLVIPGQFSLTLPLTAGQTVEFLIARDGGGNNSGGLFAYTPSATLIGLGWLPSPTAGIEVSRLEPVV